MTINSSCLSDYYLKVYPASAKHKKTQSQQAQNLRPSNKALGLSCIFCFLSSKVTNHYWQYSTYFSRLAELVILLKQGPSSPACNYFFPHDRSIARWQHFKCLISSSYSIDWKSIQTQSPLIMTQLHFQSVLPFMSSLFCLSIAAADLFSQCYSVAKPCHLLIMNQWVCLFNRKLLFGHLFFPRIRIWQHWVLAAVYIPTSQVRAPKPSSCQAV